MKVVMPYLRKSTKPVEPAKSVLAMPHRVSKRKAKMTIRNVTIPKPRAPRAPATSRAARGHTIPSVSRQASESPSGGESSDIVKSPLNDHETLIQDIQIMLQSSI